MHTTGSLDISRVKSDALPQFSLPSVITCGGSDVIDEGELNADIPRFMSDTRSINSSCSDSVSIGDNRRSASPADAPLLATLRSERKQKEEEEEGGRSEAVGQREGHQNSRPNSAPHCSRAAVNVPSNTANIRVSATKEKRKSLDFERQKRKMNIQESARAAMQYSATWKTTKTDSLPRDARASSVGEFSLSTGSEEGEAHTAAGINTTSTTSNATSPHSRRGSVTNTPLNLRHLSIDQTKEASLTQMCEIWKEVEAIGSQSGEKQDSLLGEEETDAGKAEVKVSELHHKGVRTSAEAKVLIQQVSRAVRDSEISILEPYQISWTKVREDGASRLPATLPRQQPPRSVVARKKMNNRPSSFSKRGVLVAIILLFTILLMLLMS